MEEEKNMSSKERRLVQTIRTPKNHKICDIYDTGAQKQIIIKIRGQEDIFPVEYLFNELLPFVSQKAQ